CDGVLAKPFEPQLVISRVKELLAKRQGSSPPAVSASTQPAAAPAAVPQKATPNALDDYFGRLDAAFAPFNESTPAPPTPAAARSAPEQANPEVDWFSAAMGPSGPAELGDLPPTEPAAPPLKPPPPSAS